MTYGFIGTGNMGGALARALARSVSPSDIYLNNRTAAKAEALATELGASCASAERIAAECGCVFLGVKPGLLPGLLAELRPVLDAREDKPLLVSMAAGVTIAAIEDAAPHCPVLRIMPNTACAVGEGMTFYTCSREVTDRQRQTVLDALSASGRLEELEEELMGAASAVAGCGGAFACLFLEGLADGGVLCGLPREKARRMAAQMLLGTAALALASGQHTGALKDAVCSPAGSTIAGVRKLESMSFRSAAMAAVIAAWEREKECKSRTEYLLNRPLRPSRKGRFSLCSMYRGKDSGRVNFADEPVQGPGRQNLGQKHRRLIGKADGAQGLVIGLQRHLPHKGTGLGRIHAGLLVVLHALYGAADAAAVDPVPLPYLVPGGGEAGVNVPGHDGADGDAEGPKLIGKGHGIGVDRRLGGGIIGLERNGHRRRHGA